MAPIKSAALLGALAFAISLSAALGAEVAIDWKLSMGSKATIAAQAGDVLKVLKRGALPQPPATRHRYALARLVTPRRLRWDPPQFTWSGSHDVKVMPDAASITGSCKFSGAVTTGVTNPTSSPATYTIASDAKLCDKLIFACSIGQHCKYGGVPRRYCSIQMLRRVPIPSSSTSAAAARTSSITDHIHLASTYCAAANRYRPTWHPRA